MSKLLLLGLGIGAYFYLNKPEQTARKPEFQAPVAIDLQSNGNGTFDIPIGIVKHFQLNGNTTKSNTLWMPPQVFHIDDPIIALKKAYYL